MSVRRSEGTQFVAEHSFSEERTLRLPVTTKYLETTSASEDDDEEETWRKVEEHKRTCQMRRNCTLAALVIYLFLFLLRWTRQKETLQK